jgi:hypothetical protein
MKSSANHKDRFLAWLRSASPEERELRRLAIEFGDRYFADLQLNTPSIRRRLLKMQVELDGEWVDTEDEILSPTVDDWIFRYRRFRRPFLGLCEWKARAIYIKPGQTATEHRSTVLHELLHAYERQLPPALQQWLTIDLYRRMGKIIKPAMLNRYIDVSTHSVLHDSTHGVLFLLKSLDIDHRHRWPWGTTFAYGRVEYLK